MYLDLTINLTQNALGANLYAEQNHSDIDIVTNTGTKTRILFSKANTILSSNSDIATSYNAVRSAKTKSILKKQPKKKQ